MKPLHPASAASASTEADPLQHCPDAVIARLQTELLYWKGVVRGARSELHEAGRISDDEYAALVEDTAARDNMATIDELREKLAAAMQHRDQWRADAAAYRERIAGMDAITAERDSLSASNTTFQRLVLEAHDAAAEACRQRDEMALIASKEATDGMLDVHMICEQRDKAVSERDRALAAVRLCRDALAESLFEMRQCQIVFTRHEWDAPKLNAAVVAATEQVAAADAALDAGAKEEQP